MKIKEIIVVEGKADTSRILEAVDADTIETNGSAIDESILKQIEKAQAVRGVIVLTDPDFPGGKIRETIMQRIPEVKHAFIKKADCQSPAGGSLGIEHADVKTIQEALKNVQTPYLTIKASDMPNFIRRAGLIGQPQSAAYRELIGDELGIGRANGKQFVKRIQMFQISEDDLLTAMEKLNIPVPQATKEG